MVNYNVQLLNPTDLASSFFCLSQIDPSIGFAFDASKVAGQTYPEQPDTSSGKSGLFPFRVFVPGAKYHEYLHRLARHSPATACFWLFAEHSVSNVQRKPSAESPSLRSVVVFVEARTSPTSPRRRSQDGFTVHVKIVLDRSAPIAFQSYTLDTKCPTRITAGAYQVGSRYKISAVRDAHSRNNLCKSRSGCTP
jgi:hypothetical protein